MGTLHILNGIPVPHFVDQEVLDELKEFQLYPDDVWVVTFPKCGTTWTQQIVKLIRSNGVQDKVKLTKSVPWLEARKAFPEISMDSLSRPRGFKSHFPYHLLPCGPPHATPCKYIYVARNPKDVAVSFYYHMKAAFYPDMDQISYWERFVAGELEFGDYFDHLLSWWPHRNDENVLFLKYEDMKKDLPYSVSRIASFLGADLSDDVIINISDMTTFDKMKKDPLVNCSWTQVVQERSETDFMRKGVVGDWKNFLTAEQSAQMDALYADRLKDVGLEFEYM